MKNTFFCLLALLAFNTLSAQSAIEQEALKTWNEVWQAYDRNDLAKAYSFYSAKACEIYPDGSLICGLDNIKAGYEQFVGMLEGTPSWKMDAPATRIISSDVVLMTSNVVSDITSEEMIPMAV
jgi:ketosteroid isomerase-like protein